MQRILVAYDKQSKKVRPELLQAQYDLLACKGFPVILLGAKKRFVISEVKASPKPRWALIAAKMA